MDEEKIKIENLNFITEKQIGDLIEKYPKMLIENIQEFDIHREYQIKGKFFDFLLLPMANSESANEIIVIEVKKDVSKVLGGIGQILEYKSIIKEIFGEDKAVRAIICAPGELLADYLPDEIEYIDLTENKIFLKLLSSMLISRFDSMASLLNKPFALHFSYHKKTEFKKEKQMSEIERIVAFANQVQVFNLNGKIKKHYINLFKEGFKIGRNGALNRLKEYEKKGYIQIEKHGKSSKVFLTEKTLSLLTIQNKI